MTAEQIIDFLQLVPHPIEGGFFRETYRSEQRIPSWTLQSHSEDRSLHTAIYYLLTKQAVSEMHRLPGDEIYHFYAGDPLHTLLLDQQGHGKIVTIGPKILEGQVPQLIIPGGVWQGSQRIDGDHGFTLIGATMAPGFDYTDYERGQRAELTQHWPQFADLIERLTPNG